MFLIRKLILKEWFYYVNSSNQFVQINSTKNLYIKSLNQYIISIYKFSAIYVYCIYTKYLKKIASSPKAKNIQST